MPAVKTAQCDIGAALRFFRESAGLSREHAGVHVGRGSQTIHAWENGDRIPRLEFVEKLAQLYSVSLASLFEFAGIPAPEAGDR